MLTTVGKLGYGNSRNALIERTENPYSRTPVATERSPNRRPFWLPAFGYYILNFAAGSAVFFLVWGILHDIGEEMPWVSAGIAAAAFMLAVVVMREIVLRRARQRHTEFEKRFERQLVDDYSRVGEFRRPEKLTIATNERIIADIKQKSDAANVLSKFSDAHLEVFELCRQYLLINEREMGSIGVGSPRLVALRQGKMSIERRHKYHLLQWAQIEARNLTQEASIVTKTADKVTAATNALKVLDSALEFYPREKALLDSHDLLQEMLTSIRVSHFVEKAEKATFKGNFKQAKSLYRDALFYLGRDNLRNEERNAAAEHIHSEIERIRLIEAAGKV